MDCDHQAPLSMEYENGVPEMQQMVCVYMCVCVCVCVLLSRVQLFVTP